MMQTLGNTLKYSAKVEGYQLAGAEYSNLLTRIQFEFFDPNEEDFFDNVEGEILKINTNCKYYPLQSVFLKYSEKLSLEKFATIEDCFV